MLNGQATPLSKRPLGRADGGARPGDGPLRGQPNGAPRPGSHPTTAGRPTAGIGKPTTRDGRPTKPVPGKPPSGRPPNAKPPRDRTNKTRTPVNLPGKRPASESDITPSQKRPPGNPTGVRPTIGTVNNGGSQRVNTISGNVHGFQKTVGRGGGATATAGGSRTVTVPPRRGGGRGIGVGVGVGVGGGTESAFAGRGHVLGGAQSVPWYKRDPKPDVPQRDSPAGLASNFRRPTGIFSGPEDTAKITPTDVKTDPERDLEELTPSSVSCPVCGDRVSLRTVNEHVDLCLVTECDREREGDAAESQAGPSSDAVWDDDAVDELMMSQAADEAENSLEISGWEGDVEDNRLIEAADELETSLERGAGKNCTAGDRSDIYSGECRDGARSPGSDASTAYDSISDGNDSLKAQSPVSGASTVYDDLFDGGATAVVAASSPESAASTVYDEILNEPIVIESSDDEDYVSQRANLSDVIKDFIRVEESDEEIFD